MQVDRHDARQMADDVALAATEAGYRFDFSPSSFWEVERLLETAGEDVPEHLRAPAGLPFVTFALGCYLGEVIRKARSGRWLPIDPDEALSITLDVDGSLVWPAERVAKRLVNGTEDSIVAYALLVDLDIGEPPTPPGFWAKTWRTLRHDPAPSTTRRVRRWRAQRRERLNG